MNIQYPTEIPPPLAGRTYKPVSPLKVTELQNKRKIVRRVFTNTPVFVDCEFVFTDEQGQIFERFYAVDLAEGSEWFEMEVSNQFGKAVELVRFSKIYSNHLIGMPNTIIRKWRYKATFEVHSR